MASNQPRGTPGLLLLIFAVVLTLMAGWAWVAKVREVSESVRTPHAQEEEELP